MKGLDEFDFLFIYFFSHFLWTELMISYGLRNISLVWFILIVIFLCSGSVFITCMPGFKKERPREANK